MAGQTFIDVNNGIYVKDLEELSRLVTNSITDVQTISITSINFCYGYINNVVKSNPELTGDLKPVLDQSVFLVKQAINDINLLFSETQLFLTKIAEFNDKSVSLYQPQTDPQIGNQVFDLVKDASSEELDGFTKEFKEKIAGKIGDLSNTLNQMSGLWLDKNFGIYQGVIEGSVNTIVSELLSVDAKVKNISELSQ